MLEVNISKSLGDFQLKSSFQVEKGVLGILGPSGCGKSVTLKCISGLQDPDKGSINLNGKAWFSKDAQLNLPSRKRNIGYVFQNYALFPHMNLEKNIMYGITHLDNKERKRKTWDMIEKMQLKGLEKLFPSQLSGGQQQRTALARTLITQPDLLLLDEPFSALDTHVKFLLEKELISIIKENFDGIVLLVTHNIEEAYRICDHIMVMDKGEILQMGSKDEIINKPTSLSSARITGCKNFIEVRVLEEKNDEVIIEFMGNILKVFKQPCLPSRNMIAGIRAHHLKIISDDSILDNTFECIILDKIDGVFSTTLIVDFFGSQLHIEAGKASCPNLKKRIREKIKVHIPPDQVFLMKK